MVGNLVVELIFKRLEHLRLLVLGLAPSHERADDIGLVPGCDLLAHALPCHRVLLRTVQPLGRHRCTPDGQLVEDGLVQVAVNSHCGRTWDRGRGHDEHVGMARARLVSTGGRTLLPQRGALFNPEAMLLVDHHDPQRAEADRVGQKGVRADNEVEAPVQ